MPQLSEDFYTYGGVPNPRKWEIHDPHRGRGNWAGRQPGLFIRENIWVRKWKAWNFGGLRIRAKGHPMDTQDYNRVFRKSGPGMQGDTFEDRGYSEYSMGMLSSKRAVRYGYFEVESRNMKTQLVNSWWFSSKVNGIWTEIDVYENSHVSHLESKWRIDMRLKVVPNAHAATEPMEIIEPDKLITAKPAWYTHWEHISKRPHTYGLLWTPKRIVWFFDGRPFVSIPNRHWHRKLFVRFDVETNMAWHGIVPNVWSLRKHPKLYHVHYFRVWSINFAPRGGPVRAVARVQFSEMEDEALIQGTTRMKKTTGVARDATETDELLASYFAGVADSTDSDWTMQTKAMLAKDKLKTPFCLARAPYGNEVYGMENKPPASLTMHQYIKALMAEPENVGLFERVKDYFMSMWE